MFRPSHDFDLVPLCAWPSVLSHEIHLRVKCISWSWGVSLSFSWHALEGDTRLCECCDVEDCVRQSANKFDPTGRTVRPETGLGMCTNFAEYKCNCHWNMYFILVTLIIQPHWASWVYWQERSMRRSLELGHFKPCPVSIGQEVFQSVKSIFIFR